MTRPNKARATFGRVYRRRQHEHLMKRPIWKGNHLFRFDARWIEQLRYNFREIGWALRNIKINKDGSPRIVQACEASAVDAVTKGGAA